MPHHRKIGILAPAFLRRVNEIIQCDAPCAVVFTGLAEEMCMRPPGYAAKVFAQDEVESARLDKFDQTNVVIPNKTLSTTLAGQHLDFDGAVPMLRNPFSIQSLLVFQTPFILVHGTDPTHRNDSKHVAISGGQRGIQQHHQNTSHPN